MQILLRNQIIEVGFSISRKPRLDKLETEVAEFFEQNDVEGHRIKKFDVRGSEGVYFITPLEPCLEGELSNGCYEERLEEIGKKYGLDNFGFEPFCYHK